MSDTTLETLLADCAGGGATFYSADDSAVLIASFANIGDRLREIALTK